MKMHLNSTVKIFFALVFTCLNAHALLRVESHYVSASDLSNNHMLQCEFCTQDTEVFVIKLHNTSSIPYNVAYAFWHSKSLRKSESMALSIKEFIIQARDQKSMYIWPCFFHQRVQTIKFLWRPRLDYLTRILIQNTSAMTAPSGSISLDIDFSLSPTEGFEGE